MNYAIFSKKGSWSRSLYTDGFSSMIHAIFSKKGSWSRSMYIEVIFHYEFCNFSLKKGAGQDL